MKIDNALILAAGKGTRMGEIGKELPKVLWPILGRSILELEVAYAQQFLPEQIFINVFNHKEKILEHIKSSSYFDEVTTLVEKQVLDIGGAVHNLAQGLHYRGNLLVLNSDQFMMLSALKKAEVSRSMSNNDVTLLVHHVDKKFNYGGLRIEEGVVTQLVTAKDLDPSEELITYTGMSIINLEKLKPVAGKSKFFDSVANFNQLKVGAVVVDDSFYWDFGTVNRYVYSMRKLRTEDSQFKRFIEQTPMPKHSHHVSLQGHTLSFKN